ILNSEDSLFNQEYLVVAKLHAQDTNSFINLALDLSLDLIEKYFSSLIKKEETIAYNKELNKFDIRQISTFLKLQLFSIPVQSSNGINFTKLIIDLLQNEGLELLRWSKNALTLKSRVNFLNHHQDFCDFSDENLLNTLEEWLEPYLTKVTTIKALQSLDIYSILSSTLSWEQKQILDKNAPLSIKVPSGSNIDIDYSDVEKPSIKVKIQEVFGLYESPRVLHNTLGLQIHLLTPAMTPMQITYDLKSFWEHSYSEVRKEVRGKYKRHYWPENPFEAIATNKTKKHMMKNTEHFVNK
ncbi:MAG: ATP-dependent helicase C-terminal domain-containing protein, partial [Arcobacteraceae bacterium]